MLIAYSLVLTLLIVYSFALVDLNLTLISHPLWILFRDNIVQLGYFKRDISSLVYVTFILLLFLFHVFFVKNYKRYNPLTLAALASVVLFFSYPFLSHDFFNYIFDAKIATFYHKNPYFYRGLDFPSDPWLRFMHWTHRTYPYGPSFLLITLIPSFLALGKFILNFLLFKALFIFTYIAGVFVLNKMNRRWAVFFATNPLVLIEGVVNAHNDLLAVVLALIGIFFLTKNDKIRSRVFLLISAGIKYTTLPLVFLPTKNVKVNKILLLGVIVIVGYLSIFVEVQPWYYLTFLAFIPFFYTFISRLNLLFLGLLLSYYPYVRYGEWTQASNITLKHLIIIASLALNILLILPFLRYNRKK